MNEVQALPSQYLLNRHEDWNIKVPPLANKENGEVKIAGLNIQTSWVTDSPNNLEKYPKYAWNNRLKPVVQLISLDQPTILAMSELHLKQIQDLRSALDENGYKIAGFSSETREPIEIVEEKVSQNKEYYYSEFVGFLYNSNEVQLEDISSVEQEKGERHKRVLTIGKFFHVASKVNFVVLTMHLDHLSLQSRQKSGEQELEIIRQLEEKGIPWFSIGDRNWFVDKNRKGQDLAGQYTKNDYVCDFRDENQGHYGPSGSYAGHLGIPLDCEPPIVEMLDGSKRIEAQALDVGFRSRNTIIGINDYAYSGEFSPETYELLPPNSQGKVEDKNFISDHYYIGGTFKFKV